MSRAPEFIALSDPALRAVAGANSRHVALIEDAFGVLVETPGGGVALIGDAKSRNQAKAAVQAIAQRADQGLEVSEADVRVAIGHARSGAPAGGGSAVAAPALPIGRRGQVAPKTPNQARYLEALSSCDLVFGLGPLQIGGLGAIEAVAEVAQAWPIRPIRGVADGAEAMPCRQPGGAEITELPGKVLMNQQQVHAEPLLRFPVER